jgi:hypothetical protein
LRAIFFGAGFGAAFRAVDLRGAPLLSAFVAVFFLGGGGAWRAVLLRGAPLLSAFVGDGAAFFVGVELAVEVFAVVVVVGRTDVVRVAVEPEVVVVGRTVVGVGWPSGPDEITVPPGAVVVSVTLPPPETPPELPVPLPPVPGAERPTARELPDRAASVMPPRAPDSVRPP